MKKKPLISCVYQITNISNKKFYIGSTKDFHKRKRDHRAKLNRKQHDNIHLQRSWNKHGSATFTFKIVEQTVDLLPREQHYIDTLKPQYNIGKHACGGDNLTNHPDREQIIKRRSATVRQKHLQMSTEERQKLSDNMKGSKNPNYGNKWNKKQRKKASIRQKKVQWTEERNRKVAIAVKKSWQNEERKKQWSRRLSGKGNPFYGKKHSKATMEKIKRTKLKIFENSTPEERYAKNPQTRKVDINGVIYFGVSEAARQLGVCAGTICHRIKSPNVKYKNYFYKD